MLKDSLARIGVGVIAFAILGTVALVAQAPGGAPPPDNPSFGPLIVNPLKGNVYWTQGGTGGNNCNTGFVVGDRGVIVIDAKLNAESARLMLDAIRTITAKPVTHVILTHSDGDHVNGLAAFPAGITVIAHEGAKSELERAFAAGGRGAPPVSAAPTEVVRGSGESLTIDGVKLRLVHVAPAIPVETWPCFFTISAFSSPAISWQRLGRSRWCTRKRGAPRTASCSRIAR
jgi:hypothetical protein